jgi:hypothetical protein
MTAMISNTRLKGIHYRKARRTPYQVMVQWRKVMLWGNADTLKSAIRMRDQFERQLGKPRSERRILPDATGTCFTTCGSPGKANYRDVVQAHIAPEPGKRRTTTYVLHGYPQADDLAISNAERWRLKMEARYYAVQA